MQDAYREDLAAIHDEGFGTIADEAASLLVTQLARAGLREGTITDLGCGGGRLLRRAVDAGYSGVGIDLSASAIEIARARVPEARFNVGSFLSCRLPRSVAITAVGEVLSYTFDERNDDTARDTLFARAFSALVPGGMLLFDLAIRGARVRSARHEIQAGADWVVSVETHVDEAAGTLVRRIMSFRWVGGRTRRDEETHQLLLTDPATVRRALRRIGLAVRTLVSYGDTALPPGVVAFLATKPPR